MNTGQKARVVIAFAFVALFALGTMSIFSQRFQSGSLHPQYSTHRTTPLGSKALFDTIAGLHPRSAERIENPLSLENLNTFSSDIIFVIGASRYRRDSVSVPFWKTLDEKLDQGAAITLSLRGDQFKQQASWTQSDDDLNKESDNESKKEEKTNQATTHYTAKTWLEEKGLTITSLTKDNLKASIDKTNNVILAQPSIDNLSEPLMLKTTAQFEIDAAQDWKSLYEVQGHTVVASRQYGEGRLIVVADSFPFSNEALLGFRSSEFLAFLLDGKDTFHFLELQLGIAHNEGVMSLVRRNGFTGAMILVLLASIIFVWSSSFSIAPRLPAEKDQPAGAGITEANSGKMSLLQDTLAKGKLLQTAFLEWQGSSHLNNTERSKIKKAEAILVSFTSSPSAKGMTVSFYNKMLRTLKKQRPTSL